MGSYWKSQKGRVYSEMKSSEGVINNVVSFGSVDMTRMTIRDEFACAVFNGMFAAKTFQSAELCYEIADQMMEARNKYIPPPPITVVHGQTQDPLAPIEYK